MTKHPPTCDFCGKNLLDEPASNIPPSAKFPFTDNISIFWDFGVRGRRYDACNHCAETACNALEHLRKKTANRVRRMTRRLRGT